MEDSVIVEMFHRRDENAIAETSAKYGSYLRSISYSILTDGDDAENCVNDTYIAAWNTIPPNRPLTLKTYLGKITRRLSIDQCRKNNAEKRGGGTVMIALDELAECIPSTDSPENESEREELKEMINSFLRSLPLTERQVFVRRYWYMDTVAEISALSGFSAGKITSMLFRTRQKLRKELEKEGY